MYLYSSHREQEFFPGGPGRLNSVRNPNTPAEHKGEREMKVCKLCLKPGADDSKDGALVHRKCWYESLEEKGYVKTMEILEAT